MHIVIFYNQDVFSILKKIYLHFFSFLVLHLRLFTPLFRFWSMFQTEFFSYLSLGFAHIADLDGYDHILFVTALCALYELRDWRHLLWLVTAFTLGHTVTLALSTLNILTLPSEIVEFLIPITIAVTASLNVIEIQRGRGSAGEWRLSPLQEYGKYTTALVFGFIHGMGFSTFLKSLLGKETSIALPLFAFNVGLEIGQILIIACIMALGFVATRVFRLERRDWSLLLSGAAFGVACTLILKNLPF